MTARAGIAGQVGCHTSARADYSAYLKSAAETQGNKDIRARVIDLAQSVRQVC